MSDTLVKSPACAVSVPKESAEVVPLAVIQKEMSERQRLKSEAARLQVNFQDELEQKKEKLDYINQSILLEETFDANEKAQLEQAIPTIEKYLASSVVAVRTHSEAIEHLDEYRRALITINRGLPAGTINPSSIKK